MIGKRMFVVAATLLLLIAVAGYAVTAVGGEVQPDGARALVRPLFVDTAHAEEGITASTIGEKLDEEAGISAYYKAPAPINLNDIRDLFTTIEAETGNYIIGSVSISGYTETYDVHLYVDSNGWILAYYLKNDPAAKIVDVYSRAIDTTLLETAMSVVTGQAGISLGEVTFYDFRYPNATNLLLIAEDGDSGNDFKITMPGSFGYFERSWATDSHDSLAFIVDDKYMSAEYSSGHGGTAYGQILASDLLPNMQHEVRHGEYYAALTIVYRVP